MTWKLKIDFIELTKIWLNRLILAFLCQSDLSAIFAVFSFFFCIKQYLFERRNFYQNCNANGVKDCMQPNCVTLIYVHICNIFVSIWPISSCSFIKHCSVFLTFTMKSTPQINLKNSFGSNLRFTNKQKIVFSSTENFSLGD